MEQQDGRELMMTELGAKKILITGATGHLGKAIVQQLRQQNIQPFLLLRRQGTAAPSSHLLYGDLTNPVELQSIKSQLQEMDIVIHCAAHVPKTAPDDSWEPALQKNVLGTLALVSSLLPTTKFVFISTCEVYGISEGITEQLPITEEHPLHPQSYYGFSKQMAEQALQLYSRKNNRLLTILRLANIYGPGETIQRAIPNFIRAALQGEDLILYGDGSELRDFLYIDDAAYGIIQAAWRGQNSINSIYNLASGKGIGIKDVAEKIIALSQSTATLRFQERQKRKVDYVFDIGRAYQDLYFRPSTSLEEGLRRELEWFQQQSPQL